MDGIAVEDRSRGNDVGSLTVITSQTVGSDHSDVFVVEREDGEERKCVFFMSLEKFLL